MAPSDRSPGVEADPYVAEDQCERGDQRLRGAVTQLAADLRTDHLDLLNLHTGVDRAQNLLDAPTHRLGRFLGRRQSDRQIARRAEDRHLGIRIAGALQRPGDRVAVGRARKCRLDRHAAGEIHAQIQPARKQRDHRDHDQHRRQRVPQLAGGHERKVGGTVKEFHGLSKPLSST